MKTSLHGCSSTTLLKHLRNYSANPNKISINLPREAAMGWGNEICSDSLGHMTKLAFMFVYEPSHEKTFIMPYANNKDTDQSAHLCC